MPLSALGKLHHHLLIMVRQRLTNILHSASAAKDALGNKVDESKHDAKGEAHKQAI